MAQHVIQSLHYPGVEDEKFLDACHNLLLIGKQGVIFQNSFTAFRKNSNHKD